MDATPFLFRSSRMREPIDYDPVESRKRFRQSRALTAKELRYLENWEECERRNHNEQRRRLDDLRVQDGR